MGSRWEAAHMRGKAKRRKSNRANTKIGIPDLEHPEIGCAHQFAIARIAAQLSPFHR